MQDDLCKWLAETVQKKPSEWKANEVKEFDTYIHGHEDVVKKLIVRDCFVKMQVEAMKWLEMRLNSESRTGFFRHHWHSRHWQVDFPCLHGWVLGREEL